MTKKYVIVGGGITGLSAAYFLKKKEPKAKITLIEKSNRLGGYIETCRQGGFLFEKGPRTFQKARSPHLLSLLSELNIPILSSNPLADKRFIYRKGKLCSPPSLLLRSFFSLLKEVFRKGEDRGDESIYDFATRRFNSHIAELFFDPLTLGIYGGDIKKLSIHSCFPTLVEWERRYGSVIKGLLKSPKKERGLFTIEKGMDVLIDKLSSFLEIEWMMGKEAKICNPHSVQIGDTLLKVDHVIDATPIDLPKKSLWVVHLAFEKNSLSKQGFGYLVPSFEKEKILGVVFDSVIFPEQSRKRELRMTVMLSAETEDVEHVAIQTVKRHLQIRQEPIYQASFFAKEAIAQHYVGCQQKARVSVESCVERGKELADTL